MGMIGFCKAITPAELASILTDPAQVDAFVHSVEKPPLDLDKAWYGIHFLLTGEHGPDADPQSWAIMGGSVLEGPAAPDLGYGPPRYMNPHEVAAVAAALSTIPAETLAGRFDAEKFEAEGIYPNVWADDPEALDYLIQNYRNLVQLYADAAEAGHAMLLWIS
jgi:Domain of unknown function (DUF1877)